VIRFVDLCAGLGGFHRALSLAEIELRTSASEHCRFECVGVAELDLGLRRSYVSNFGLDGYARLFPPDRTRELAESLRASSLEQSVCHYGANDELEAVHGDLSVFVDADAGRLRSWPSSDGETVLPPHDLLCAGFPCQPFSKSGSQKGFDELRGTVFHQIAIILQELRPALVLLENVGNFDRHDGGDTWRRVKDTLVGFGYEVSSTSHKASGGADSRGLLSPHHLGYPHHRERFFIIAQQPSLDWLPTIKGRHPFPARPSRRSDQENLDTRARERLSHIVHEGWKTAPVAAIERAQLNPGHVDCIEHWNRLLSLLREYDSEVGEPVHRKSMPSFPIWGYELDPWQWYPAEHNPRDLIEDPGALRKARAKLLDEAAREVEARSGGRVSLFDHAPLGERSFLSARNLESDGLEAWIRTWPAYASKRPIWPEWKQRFIKQNRSWALDLWARLGPDEVRRWLDKLFLRVPAASNQKLEWNCKGEVLDLWEHILQFRPSGLRVKRFRHVPALVAMTTTQIPVVPRVDPSEPICGGDASVRSRHLLPTEALLLQGFPANWNHPPSRDAAFRAFGNAVHCELVSRIVSEWLGRSGDGAQHIPPLPMNSEAPHPPGGNEPLSGSHT
jgi:DNA (cytosine-5)-methyltransferase 1